MKFGKLENVDHVDFFLPEINFIRPVELSPTVQNLHFFSGTTGWTHKDLKGTFYPVKIRQADQLFYYSKQCNAVELNTTHYRIPDPDLIQKWVKSVPKDFKFCPKILKYISHSKLLGVDTDRIDRFCDHIRYFGSHLGPCFLQLPPYFDPLRLRNLERFLEVFPIEIPLSIELRHPAWFDELKTLEMLASILSEQNRGLVITDVAGRRDVAHMLVTGSHLIIRFGGNGGHPSDLERMDQWKKFILQCAENKIKEVYFFSHQSTHSANFAMHDLMYFKDAFHNHNSIITRGPSPIDNPLTLFNQ